MAKEVFFMLEILKIDDKNSESIIEKLTAVREFSYESGYVLRSKDLGDKGVILEIGNKNEEGRAIILPPEKAKEFGQWLLRIIGGRKWELPKELAGILERLIGENATEQKLKRNEKAKIKAAIRILKSKSRN